MLPRAGDGALALAVAVFGTQSSDAATSDTATADTNTVDLAVRTTSPWPLATRHCKGDDARSTPRRTARASIQLISPPSLPQHHGNIHHRRAQTDRQLCRIALSAHKR